MLSFSQDTISHITSGCLNTFKASTSDSCPEGVNFKYSGDTLKIYGTIGANCCGAHFLQIQKLNDTIYIASVDTGDLCLCSCAFCFEIGLKISSIDTIVSLNGEIFNIKTVINSISTSLAPPNKIVLYPNPTSGILKIDLKSIVNIKCIRVTDISGRVIKEIEKNTREIDLSDFESGLYLIYFELGDHQKIVKRILRN